MAVLELNILADKRIHVNKLTDKKKRIKATNRHYQIERKS